MQLEMSEYDCLMRAWQNSQELVRDFEMYSKKIQDDSLKSVFKKFAEEEGHHATIFREFINNYTKSQ